MSERTVEVSEPHPREAERGAQHHAQACRDAVELEPITGVGLSRLDVARGVGEDTELHTRSRLHRRQLRFVCHRQPALHDRHPLTRVTLTANHEAMSDKRPCQERGIVRRLGQPRGALAIRQRACAVPHAH